jgi:HSP20 family protein
MSITRWDPFQDFLNLQREVGRLFEKTFGIHEGGKKSSSEWIPAIDVYQTKDKVVVKAELPEIEAKDIEVTLEKDRLVIKGERNLTDEVKEEDFYRLERRYGRFQRVIPIPASVKADEVAASYHDGILEVNLPKTEEVKPKQIKIKSNVK